MTNETAKILSMLDWNNTHECQAEGLALAQRVTDLRAFLQPTTLEYNKNVWDNCARVLSERSDEELEPYLPSMMRWLKNLDWPGARLIAHRLCRFQNLGKLRDVQAELQMREPEEENSRWFGNIEGIILEKNRSFYKD